MTSCIRQSFAGRAYQSLAANVSHPGLWFDRFLEEQVISGDPLTPYSRHIDHCCDIAEPDIYKPFFERWLVTLDRLQVRPRIAHTTYRLAVGHGREAVIETGMMLHHTFGVPYIPGSSLKGVAASYADEKLGGLWKRDGNAQSNAYETLFGSTTSAGFVDFLDALPIPGTWKLLPDVLTVHHSRYFRNEPLPPADWDDPTPIPFLTATGDFLIALHAISRAEAWIEAGYGILKMALEEEGIGGKTSSGYGRLRLEADSLPRLEIGATLRAKVIEVNRGDVILTPQESFLMGLPLTKEPYFYIPSDQTGNRQFAEGKNITCVVMKIDEDEYDFIVTCRPQTKQERSAGKL